MSETVQIVEVGPRDGLQSIGAFVPTDTKITLIRILHEAGTRRMESTSFVSQSAVPQMADAAELVAATALLDGLDAQVLVPNARQMERALEAGALHIAAFLSASETHNLANIRRTLSQSIEDFAAMIAMLPAGGKMRLNLATAFDCPFDGRVAPEHVVMVLDRLLAVTNNVEIALCDTTGRADPRQVRDLFTLVMARFPGASNWVFHGHDTYGMGAANVMAAFDAGVRIFDASIGGLGGCPFAPGATGNVASEDIAWMFAHMGVETGLDMNRLLSAAHLAVGIEGAQSGGRVRQALRARVRRKVAA